MVANVSPGESFKVFFEEDINAQGSNFIIIYSQEPNIFYTNELEIIKQTTGISGISPVKQQSGEGTYFSETKNIEIAGVTADYQDTANIIMEEGIS